MKSSLLFCLLFFICKPHTTYAVSESLLKDFYFVYPDNLAPNIVNLQRYADQDRYEVLAYPAAIYVPDASNQTSKEEILLRYRFINEYYGFIFDSSGVLEYVLMRKSGTTKTFSGYVGELLHSDQSWTYYEKLPSVRADWISSRFYGDQTVYATTKELPLHAFTPSLHCLVRGEDATVQMCNEIPKCYGYVIHSSQTDACILNYLAQELVFRSYVKSSASEATIYIVHKNTQKSILHLIETYRPLAVFSLSLLYCSQVLIFNFDLSRRALRNIKRAILYLRSMII